MVGQFLQGLRVRREVERRRGLKSTYTEPLPEDDPLCQDFLKRYYGSQLVISQRQEEIPKLLEAFPDTLAIHYEAWVPSPTSHEDFWQRYYYRCDPELIAKEWEREQALQEASIQPMDNCFLPWAPTRHQRAEQEVTRLRSRRAVYTESLPLPVQDPEVRAFVKTYYGSQLAIAKRQTEITKLLEKHEGLKMFYDTLVPEQVSHEDFWMRYYFRCNLERVLETWDQQEQVQAQQQAESCWSIVAIPSNWAFTRRQRAEQEVAKRRDCPLTYAQELNTQDPQVKQFLQQYYAGQLVIAKRNEETTALLQKHSTLAIHYNSLVPATVSSEDFWMRFFYRCDIDRVLREMEGKADSVQATMPAPSSIPAFQAFGPDGNPALAVESRSIALTGLENNEEAVPALERISDHEDASSASEVTESESEGSESKLSSGSEDIKISVSDYNEAPVNVPAYQVFGATGTIPLFQAFGGTKERELELVESPAESTDNGSLQEVPRPSLLASEDVSNCPLTAMTQIRDRYQGTLESLLTKLQALEKEIDESAASGEYDEDASERRFKLGSLSQHLQVTLYQIKVGCQQEQTGPTAERVRKLEQHILTSLIPVLSRLYGNDDSQEADSPCCSTFAELRENYMEDLQDLLGKFQERECDLQGSQSSGGYDEAAQDRIFKLSSMIQHVMLTLQQIKMGCEEEAGSESAARVRQLENSIVTRIMPVKASFDAQFGHDSDNESSSSEIDDSDSDASKSAASDFDVAANNVQGFQVFGAEGLLPLYQSFDEVPGSALEGTMPSSLLLEGEFACAPFTSMWQISDKYQGMLESLLAKLQALEKEIDESAASGEYDENAGERRFKLGSLSQHLQVTLYQIKVGCKHEVGSEAGGHVRRLEEQILSSLKSVHSEYSEAREDAADVEVSEPCFAMSQLRHKYTQDLQGILESFQLIERNLQESQSLSEYDEATQDRQFKLSSFIQHVLLTMQLIKMGCEEEANSDVATRVRQLEKSIIARVLPVKASFDEREAKERPLIAPPSCSTPKRPAIEAPGDLLPISMSLVHEKYEEDLEKLLETLRDMERELIEASADAYIEGAGDRLFKLSSFIQHVLLTMHEIKRGCEEEALGQTQVPASVLETERHILNNLLPLNDSITESHVAIVAPVSQTVSPAILPHGPGSVVHPDGNDANVTATSEATGMTARKVTDSVPTEDTTPSTVDPCMDAGKNSVTVNVTEAAPSTVFKSPPTPAATPAVIDKTPRPESKAIADRSNVQVIEQTPSIIKDVNESPISMTQLREKYLDELIDLLNKFKKMERQMDATPASDPGAEERRFKLTSFIQHIQLTLHEIEKGFVAEVAGKAPIAEEVKKIEEHIMANLMPVKARLDSQIASKKGSKNNLRRKTSTPDIVTAAKVATTTAPVTPEPAIEIQVKAVAAAEPVSVVNTPAGEADAAESSVNDATEDAQTPVAEELTLMAQLREKYLDELFDLLGKFQKMERQMDASPPSDEGATQRRFKLTSFIQHIQQTLHEIEEGYENEAAGKGPTVDDIKKIEAHIMANLIPVKARLDSQMAAKKGSKNKLHDQTLGSSPSVMAALPTSSPDETPFSVPTSSDDAAVGLNIDASESNSESEDEDESEESENSSTSDETPTLVAKEHVTESSPENEVVETSLAEHQVTEDSQGPASDGATERPTSITQIRDKYSDELEDMLRTFQKMDRQLNTSSASDVEARREKIRSFVQHLEVTLEEIEMGFEKELGGEVAPMEAVQQLEDHILTNLLPVKSRLDKQLATQKQEKLKKRTTIESAVSSQSGTANEEGSQEDQSHGSSADGDRITVLREKRSAAAGEVEDKMAAVIRANDLEHKLERDAAVMRANELEYQLKVTTEKLETLKSRSQTLEKQLTRAHDELDEVRAELNASNDRALIAAENQKRGPETGVREERNAADSHANDFETKLQEAATQLEALQSTNNLVGAQLAAMTEERDRAETKLEESMAKVEELSARIGELQKTLGQVKSLEEDREAALARAKDAETKLQEAARQLDDVQSINNSIVAQLATITKERDGAQTELELSKAKVEELSARISELQKTSGQVKSLEDDREAALARANDPTEENVQVQLISEETEEAPAQERSLPQNTLVAIMPLKWVPLELRVGVSFLAAMFAAVMGGFTSAVVEGFSNATVEGFDTIASKIRVEVGEWREQWKTEREQATRKIEETSVRLRHASEVLKRNISKGVVLLGFLEVLLLLIGVIVFARSPESIVDFGPIAQNTGEQMEALNVRKVAPSVWG